ncbi:MAG: LCP family protein [Propioniciclava sp.]
MKTTRAPRRAIHDARPRKGMPRGVLGGFLALSGVVVALGLVLGTFYVWRVWDTASDVERIDTLLPSAEDTTRPAEEKTAEGSFNYVFMGSDSRGEGDRGRSDVLMLAHVPPTRDKVYVVSFPRDMWVEIPGRGHAKINAAYAWGGDALATRTLESLVGVRMDHAVKIDFEGFIGLTDELGGVTVYNAVATEGIGESGTLHSFPQGEIVLEGDAALTYVRQRYELPNGDLGRAERQRIVVKAIMKELLSRDLLTKPATFNAVLGSLGQYLTVDEGLTNQELLTTAASMRLEDLDRDIVLLQAHIASFGRSPDGQDINIVDEPQLAELATAIQTGTMDAYAEKYWRQPFVG